MDWKRIQKGSDRMAKQYLTAAEIAEIVGVSLGKSYQLIRTMNAELSAEGYLTVSGKIPEAFFKKKYYGYEHGKP